MWAQGGGSPCFQHGQAERTQHAHGAFPARSNALHSQPASPHHIILCHHTREGWLRKEIPVPKSVIKGGWGAG